MKAITAVGLGASLSICVLAVISDDALIGVAGGVMLMAGFREFLNEWGRGDEA